MDAVTVDTALHLAHPEDQCVGQHVSRPLDEVIDCFWWNQRRGRLPDRPGAAEETGLSNEDRTSCLGKLTIGGCIAFIAGPVSATG